MAQNLDSKAVIVYVNSDTEEGIETFIEAYPTAEEVTLEDIADLTDWRVLVYPSFATSDDSLLDIYYKAKHLESKTLIEIDNIKNGVL